MKITIIAAHDLNHGIGYQNQLPWRLSADLAFFKQKTLGQTILMGRKTFESIGKPLSGRRNIILTSQDMCIPGVEIISDYMQLYTMNIDALMIIGGSSLYQHYIDLADDMLITEVAATCHADAFFPKYDKQAYKKTVLGSHPSDEKNQYSMRFNHYKRIK